jgi:L-cysteine/cystine lyase
VVTPFLPDPEKVRAIRADLPATAAGIFMNAGTCGPIPVPAAQAMAAAAERELMVGRAHRDAYDELLVRMDETRAVVAAVLGTGVDRVALTGSTTEGLAAAILTIDWRAGDRVVTTAHEHPGLTATLAMLRDRRGVEIVVADVDDGGDHDRTVEAVEAAIGPSRARRPRLVALSHVLWTTGAVLPVARIVEAAHAAGVPVALDGAQAAGAIPLDIDAIGADFYAVPGQKWLLGPEGTGALAVSSDALAWAEPTAAGYFGAAAPYATGRAHLWADARRFEIAGFHKPSIVGLGRAIGWLSMYVGLPWAYTRAAALAVEAAARLRGIPGVTVVTPPGAAGTLLTFHVNGWPAETVVAELGRRIFLVARPIPGFDAVRLSIGWWNTDDEIGRVVDAVAELARHTPDTLPRRPTIAMIDALTELGDR